jgi:hypothetical protein
VKHVIVGLALGLALSGCGGTPSKADCEAAMRQKIEDFKAGGGDTKHPAECAGVPEEEVREIFFRLMSELMEENFGKNP